MRRDPGHNELPDRKHQRTETCRDRERNDAFPQASQLREPDGSEADQMMLFPEDGQHRGRADHLRRHGRPCSANYAKPESDRNAADFLLEHIQRVQERVGSQSQHHRRARHLRVVGSHQQVVSTHAERRRHTRPEPDIHVGGGQACRFGRSVHHVAVHSARNDRADDGKRQGDDRNQEQTRAHELFRAPSFIPAERLRRSGHHARGKPVEEAAADHHEWRGQPDGSHRSIAVQPPHEVRVDQVVSADRQCAGQHHQCRTEHRARDWTFCVSFVVAFPAADQPEEALEECHGTGLPGGNCGCLSFERHKEDEEKRYC